MNSIKHSSNNYEYQKPEELSEDICGALPVTLEVHNGMPYVCSFWEPTPSELAALNAGCPIKLWVIGQGMPPVALSVEE